MKRLHLSSVSSTSDVVKDLLSKEPEVIVTADYQTNGRGRNNKKWFGDNSENVYLSIGLNHTHKLPFTKIMLFQAVGSLAVYNILSRLTDKNIIRLKYPNDVLIKHKNIYKKISGVITEHSFTGDFCTQTIIGIGINISQKDFPFDLKDSAVSLHILDIDYNVSTVTDLLVEELTLLLKSESTVIMNLWKKCLNIENKIVILQDDEEKYRVKKINSDGTLYAEHLDTKVSRIINNGDSIRYDYE